MPRAGSPELVVEGKFRGKPVLLHVCLEPPEDVEATGTKVSDGYLDDTCDGLVEVRLRVGGSSMLDGSLARISGADS